MSKGRKTWERAYAAGLIDGEGCIGISRINRTNYSQWNGNFNNHEYRLTVNINMTDRKALDFIYGAFGGYILPVKQYDLERLPVYRWEVRSKAAMQFLKQILFALRTKKEQAELAIRFQSLKSRQTYGRNNPLPQYTWERYEKYYQEAKQLKNPRAAVTSKQDDPNREAVLYACSK
jgi:hypothetical protein